MSPVNKAITPQPEEDAICIFGAREHNLKNLNLSIPRDQFVVITGVSGSGKSTLAFDLIFAEGQRRFLDAMNAYARQFVEQMARPEVDLITGLPPTVSIEQRNSRGGGKSTVATVTEIYHFIRLLFARLGLQYCPKCQQPVQAQTRDLLRQKLFVKLKKRGDLLLLAPIVRNRKGFHTDVGEWAAKRGYKEIRADGKLYSTSEKLRLDRFREHDIEIVVGVLERRARDAKAAVLIDEALDLGNGVLLALDNHRDATVHSTSRACPTCGDSFPSLDPKFFSYNSAQGWCRSCRGFGETFFLPEADRGARADAVEESWFSWQEGKREVCPDCEGTRLNPVARAVRLPFKFRKTGLPSGMKARLQTEPTVDTLAQCSVSEAAMIFERMELNGREAEIARDILPEIRERLKFLCEVGLEYLQLGRSVTTLSGGESQRIRLASQLGSTLSGVLYVLDEPTIGLHSRDNEHLLRALDLLKERGNSLLVVEHDEETMRRADFIIDLGPGAGVHGGTVVASGTLAELQQHPESLTGKYLREKPTHPARGKRRPIEKKSEKTCLILHGANLHNLKEVTVSFPLNRFVVVTGVSGSGKSTLIRECLLPAMKTALEKGKSAKPPANLTGHENFKAVYEVDQSPIGRTPRSTPATYVGFFDEIRALYAQTPEARLRGYTGSRFSFNSAQGRCPNCEGAGTIKLEMNFLPPAYILCETCQGCRYNRETLDITYREKTIAQVMEMSVAEALEFFQPVPKIRRPLEALRDTGLDYLRLGQISPTLSGGEAQRIKLVSHLLTGLKDTGDLFDRRGKSNLFILEEPTIGLHMADVQKLVEVIQRLVDAGHSVIVIEHNLDLIAEADWVIDMGPEAGENGGKIVAEGTPEQVAKSKISHTGRFLSAFLRSSER
ncbi:MAG: excinuclease ABC subunit UvrA [Verrucomicrobiota bacterium]|nr:excinuclease ABC subunit UvrA [Verrucomicrobiota bacterium]